MIMLTLLPIGRTINNGRNSWRCYLYNSSRRNDNLCAKGFEKKLMKLLIAVIIVVTLVGAIVVYSNIKSSDKTIVEGNGVVPYRTSCVPLTEFEENN